MAIRIIESSIRCKECLNCENSIPDPEVGYSCGLEMWKYFCKKPYLCPFLRRKGDKYRWYKWIKAIKNLIHLNSSHENI